MKHLFLLLFMLFSLFCGAKSLRPLVWVLDAGHGGHDQGTSYNGVLEKDLNLEIVQELKKILRKKKPGIKLILTRDDDRYISLEERCRIANNANADLFLSVHINSAPNNPFVSGTETFYANLASSRDAVQSGTISRSSEKSELLAWLIQKSYYEAGRPSSRGAKKDRLYVLMNTNMPAVLTEVGFLSNMEDAAYMNSKRGQKDIAQNIYTALEEYYTTTQAKTHHETLLALRRSSFRSLKADVSPSDEVLAANDIVEVEGAVPDRKDPTPEEVERMVREELQKKAPVKTQNKPASNVTTKEPAVEVATVKEADEKKESFAPSPAIPVYSIQIVAVGNELKSNDPRLKGLYPVTFVKSGNVFKGLYGGTTDYKQAQATLTSIREQFPDAFIVAYLGEKPITTAEALKMYP